MNLGDIVNQIQTDYPESEIEGLLKEKLRAVPESVWRKEGYSSASAWYKETGNGAIDDAVIDDLIIYWERHYNRGPGLDDRQRCELHDRLLEEYYALA